MIVYLIESRLMQPESDADLIAAHVRFAAVAISSAVALSASGVILGLVFVAAAFARDPRIIVFVGTATLIFMLSLLWIGRIGLAKANQAFELLSRTPAAFEDGGNVQ